jgi:hypothetical protein
VFFVPLMRRGVSARTSTTTKGAFPRTAATLLLAVGALLLTGCQPVYVVSRPVDVTPVHAPITEAASGNSAGMDLHFGFATFGITCATDSAGDSTRGTAALMCTWRTTPRLRASWGLPAWPSDD